MAASATFTTREDSTSLEEVAKSGKPNGSEITVHADSATEYHEVPRKARRQRP